MPRLEVGSQTGSLLDSSPELDSGSGLDNPRRPGGLPDRQPKSPQVPLIQAKVQELNLEYDLSTDFGIPNKTGSI